MIQFVMINQTVLFCTFRILKISYNQGRDQVIFLGDGEQASPRSQTTHKSINEQN